MMILKSHTVGPLQVKAYIIGCSETKDAVIIDPAGSEDMLVKEIRDMGLNLRYIINTHGHPDHTVGNARVKALTGAKVLMHQEDDTLFRGKEAIALFKSWGFEPAPPADAYIKGGDELKIGRLSFKVLHTPGHSPGSVCLYGHGYIITGDTLFVGAAGRTDLIGGSFDTLVRSLKENIAVLPDETIVLPGHDYGDTPTSTIGREKRENPYLKECCTD
ncbi:MAG: MBL fold metallo-hydrolase [Dissulfurimicrobium sp.]|uniref:MBL fold metallo-hydrolase n=1 Tax=Dissulfurimicrobium TaxID=1769732 RepID=UPI003C7200FB